MSADAHIPQARRFDPLEYPAALELPKQVNAVAWQEHIPFAMALVEMLRPRVLVELGVHTGDSYLAFCQAVQRTGVECRCFGVDTWRGDAHAGFYGDEVLQRLRGHHDAAYGGFSRLVQSTFDAAAAHLEDGSVDLLHIDGLHTYEAVRHDWETWRPKLSSRSVALFHDVNVRENDFGVWRLWSELEAEHPSFAFAHGHGLGVLAFGTEPPSAFRLLLQATAEEKTRIAAFYFALGNRITLEAQVRELRRRSAQLADKVRECDALALSQKARIDSIDAHLVAQQALVEAHCKHLEEYDALARSLRARNEALERQVAALKGAAARDGELLADARRRAEAAEAAAADMASSRTVRAIRAVRGIGQDLKRVVGAAVKGPR